MKKTTILLFSLFTFIGFAQSKSTGVMSLNNGIPITANFTLNNDTSAVTLVLTGPSDRWFGLGIGVVAGFGMQNGDVIVYTTALSDRNFVGTGTPAVDAAQSWTTVSNTTAGTIRTLTLTRSLTNTDANDFQMPYASTNSISVGGARPTSATTSIGGHGGQGGFATAVFTTLGVEDFSLNAAMIYPNPSKGIFTVKAKSDLKSITIYSQTGALIKSVQVTDFDNTEINVEGLSTGIYLLELQNDTDRSWKKVIVE
jgi:hypothetical protein